MRRTLNPSISKIIISNIFSNHCQILPSRTIQTPTRSRTTLEASLRTCLSLTLVLECLNLLQTTISKRPQSAMKIKILQILRNASSQELHSVFTPIGIFFLFAYSRVRIFMLQIFNLESNHASRIFASTLNRFWSASFYTLILQRSYLKSWIHFFESVKKLKVSEKKCSLLAKILKCFGRIIYKDRSKMDPQNRECMAHM